MSVKCVVDLTRTDCYEGLIPDADVETCLKVLRTIRLHALSLPSFDADAAVVLSHAHAKIHDTVQQVINLEREDDAKGREAATPSHEQYPDEAGCDPDLTV